MRHLHMKLIGEIFDPSVNNWLSVEIMCIHVYPLLTLFLQVTVWRCRCTGSGADSRNHVSCTVLAPSCSSGSPLTPCTRGTGSSCRYMHSSKVKLIAIYIILNQGVVSSSFLQQWGFLRTIFSLKMGELYLVFPLPFSQGGQLKYDIDGRIH